MKITTSLILGFLCSLLLAACGTTGNPTGQVGVSVGPNGTNVVGGIGWDISTNVTVNVNGAVNPATGEWSSNLLITFKSLPDAETMQLASKAGAGIRDTKSAAVQYVLCYDSTNRDHRLFIRAAQARGALISGLK